MSRPQPVPSDLTFSYGPRPASVSTPPRPSPLSRPHWPWASRYYSHRPSSSASSHSVLGSPAQTGMNWETPPNVMYQHHQSYLAASVMDDTSIKQWTFTAFEWTIRNVSALRDFVENASGAESRIGSTSSEMSSSSAEDDEMPDILKESPTIGEGRFKLEIARTPIPDDAVPSTPTRPVSFLPSTAPSTTSGTLSLYMTSLMVDLGHTDYEVSASMMAAIKCQEDRAGERGARADWAWEYWEHNWCFRKGREVWECTLPPLSTLLENPRISASDTFVLCIQIHSPIGPMFPQQPSAFYVPRDLLEGLEESLDNPHTGDVRFICLERSPNSSISSGNLTPHSRHSSSSSSPRHASSPPLTARKRVIYAHSDILKRRSEYFATMLSGSFSETNTVIHPGERRIHNVIVEEADFVTIYWLLKWVYANWLLFREEDDPREVVDSMGAGWSAKWLMPIRLGGPGEWDWRPLIRSGPMSEENSVGSTMEDSDIHPALSIASTESTSSIASPRARAVEKGKKADVAISLTAPRTQQSRSPSGSSHTPTNAPPHHAVPSTPSRRPGKPSQGPSSASIRQSGYVSSPSSSKHYPPPLNVPPPISPSQLRHPSAFHPPQPAADPHPHPTPSPTPASALSIYQIAHRYSISALASLALDHMLNTITPATAFPLLLASHFWEELRTLVEDYVVERWDEVSRSDEFEKCCLEVAGGEWGPEGGRTLSALFRRLSSPGGVRYSRA